MPSRWFAASADALTLRQVVVPVREVAMAVLQSVWGCVWAAGSRVEVLPLCVSSAPW